jgi:hypothetical protein
MSKLYTKEMFLIAAEKCEVSMIDAKHIMQYIDEYVTPIQIPTDEEVYQEAKSKGGLFVNWNMYETSAFVMGAQWMKDKIKGGQDNE